MKYGSVPPEEALKFVTLNPARQLRIDPHVGSIEPGKQADLVVWSGPPLSLYSRCEQTWIDGQKYFDIDEDKQQRDRQRALRSQLIQAILASGEKMSKPGKRRRMKPISGRAKTFSASDMTTEPSSLRPRAFTGNHD